MVNNTGKFFVFGVVSFGLSPRCEQTSTYSVFGYLNREVMKWINNTIA